MNPADQIRTNVFPFGIWAVTLVLNVTESNFMAKCLTTVLTSIIVALMIQQSQLIAHVSSARKGRPTASLRRF
jgi:hypothetical protein